MRNKIINNLENLCIFLLALALLVHVHDDSLKYAELEAQFENEINQVRFETQAHIEKLGERIKELENQATQETAFSADLSHEKIRGIIHSETSNSRHIAHAWLVAANPTVLQARE